MKKNSFVNKIFWNKIIKNSQISNFVIIIIIIIILVLNLVPFYGGYYYEYKDPGTSYQSLSSQPNMIRNILSVVIYPLANFDALKQRGFEVIRKITIDDLCKPIHDAIIITL